jgi:hypothetical protein
MTPAIADEVGDLLFSAVNLAATSRSTRKPLRGANAKFERRFRFIEQALRDTRVHGRLHPRRVGRPVGRSQTPGKEFAQLRLSSCLSE